VLLPALGVHRDASGLPVAARRRRACAATQNDTHGCTRSHTHTRTDTQTRRTHPVQLKMQTAGTDDSRSRVDLHVRLSRVRSICARTRVHRRRPLQHHTRHMRPATNISAVSPSQSCAFTVASLRPRVS
jgi:hypothetical protein